jgi:pSer/pThr/pTyr-binding forkhead associated (FHA) protein
MRVQCPRCDATIHIEDPQDAPKIIKCWMCRATIDTPRGDSGPKTIKTSSRVRESVDPVALGIVSSKAAASTDLPLGKRVRLQLISEVAEGIEFELTKSLTTIGRKGGGADIEIDDPEVSRSHCAIEVRGDGILLHDLRSTNGTYLRGSPVTVIRLAPMSIFRIGTSHLRVKEAG